MNVLLDLVLLGGSVSVAASAQLYGASVFIHHTGHGQGIKPRWLGKVIAEAIGIVLLKQPVALYKSEHHLHHKLKSFARSGLDPDAMFLSNLGFLPGDPVDVSYRKLRRVLWSPVVHSKLIANRLKINFARREEPLRTAAAWVIWAAILGFAAHQGALAALLVFVVMAMVAGNIASLLELVSRHKWFITGASERDRQWAYSHARFSGAAPPDNGESVWEWIKWAGTIMIAIGERLLVTPGDLALHIGHHAGWDKDDFAGQPVWANPDYAYAGYLDKLDGKVFWSTRAAIDAWFKALAEATQPAETGNSDDSEEQAATSKR